MSTIKDLKEFVTYCEAVIEEANDNWLLDVITATISEDELLIDATGCIRTYYQYLNFAVENEMYCEAGIIHTALQEHELEHYKALGKGIFKNSFTKQIKAIDEACKIKYLING